MESWKWNETEEELMKWGQFNFSHISLSPKTMDDFPIDVLQISGTALASLLHRASVADGDIHGYLFGISAVSTPNALSDDPTLITAPVLTATITSSLSLPSHLALPPPPPPSPTSHLLGWFSARRKTPIRPSMKDSAASSSISSALNLTFTPQNSTLSLPPSLFLLLTTPVQDQLIHTHEYKAFQFRQNGVFEAKSVAIVNIGPSFRSQYDTFIPTMALPLMEPQSNAMLEDEEGKNVDAASANVVDIGRLKRLMGNEYTMELEGLYDKMLANAERLSKLVEESNARVVEQENRNMVLRCKVAAMD